MGCSATPRLPAPVFARIVVSAFRIPCGQTWDEATSVGDEGQEDKTKTQERKKM